MADADGGGGEGAADVSGRSRRLSGEKPDARRRERMRGESEAVDGDDARPAAEASRPRAARPGKASRGKAGLTGGGVPPLQLPEPDGGHDELRVYGVRRFSPADSPVIFAMRFHGPPVKHTAFQPCGEFASDPAGALERKVLKMLFHLCSIKHETRTPRRRGSIGLELPPGKIRGHGDFRGCGAVRGRGAPAGQGPEPGLDAGGPDHVRPQPHRGGGDTSRGAGGEGDVDYLPAAKFRGEGDGKGRRKPGAGQGRRARGQHVRPRCRARSGRRRPIPRRRRASTRRGSIRSPQAAPEAINALRVTLHDFVKDPRNGVGAVRAIPAGAPALAPGLDAGPPGAGPADDLDGGARL